jgi:hypothetical protein
MWVEQLFKSLMADRYYKLMLDTACVHFPSIPRHLVTLQTNELDVCEGHFVDITAEIWDDVIALLNVLQVARRTEMTSPVPLPLDARAPSLPASGGGQRPPAKHDTYISYPTLFPTPSLPASGGGQRPPAKHDTYISYPTLFPTPKGRRVLSTANGQAPAKTDVSV